MSSTPPVPGMMFPTQQSMLAGDPRSSAIAAQNSRSASQSAANKAMAGGKYRNRNRNRKYKGGADTLVVPQFTMSYSPTGGPGSNPNDQVKSSSQTSTQMSANSVYDNDATKMGGTRRHKSKKSGNKSKKSGNKSKRGGNPDWDWGCSSGGKRSKKYNKSNKSNKRNKSNKNKTRKCNRK
jgi:hypothetical protein